MELKSETAVTTLDHVPVGARPPVRTIIHSDTIDTESVEVGSTLSSYLSSMQRRRTQRLEQPMQLGGQLSPHRHVGSQPRLV